MTRFLLLALLSASLPAHAGTQFQDFLYAESADPFTDEDRSHILSPDVGGSRHAALGWKCMEDGLNVLYLFGKYLGGDHYDRVLVRYRIDQNPSSQPIYWKLLVGHRAAFIPMHLVEPFTMESLGGVSVAFEVVDPLDGERLRHSFSLSGLDQAIAQLPCASSLPSR